MGSNETTLKPCPFCGSEPVMRHGGRYGFWALCQHCGAALRMSDTEADAANAWNRRAGEAQTSDELEDAVRTMRAAQKEYFKTRSYQVLSDAKHAERYVDNILAMIDGVEEDNNQPKQGELL